MGGSSTWPPFGARRGGEALPAISRELLAVVPAGTGWVDHFDGRCFQQAEYLLDPVAYRTQAQTWRERERTVAYRIVTGDVVFADHARTGQGFPWRCSTSAFLVAAVQRIDSLDVDAVRQEFSVAEMHALGLYKVHAGEDDNKAFARLLTELREFAEHCRTVAAKDLDLNHHALLTTRGDDRPTATEWRVLRPGCHRDVAVRGGTDRGSPSSTTIARPRAARARRRQAPSLYGGEDAAQDGGTALAHTPGRPPYRPPAAARPARRPAARAGRAGRARPPAAAAAAATGDHRRPQ
ncbi:hypothetical protein [Actinoplanes auranticolor]|uniref:hypothetical protein n=1 Tax=Actinoplanes auranticolor TaxID=47988 RepID=UPI001BB39894|nr:hypothetical protein [Actinoplanes auranticolor]